MIAAGRIEGILRPSAMAMAAVAAAAAAKDILLFNTCFHGDPAAATKSETAPKVDADL